MADKAHWEDTYSKKSADQVSWHREHLSVSLELIAKMSISRNAAIIDIGGGASTLIDDLL